MKNKNQSIKSDVGIIKSSQLNNLVDHKHKDAIVLSGKDLQRMKDVANTLTKDEEKIQRNIQKEQLEQQRAVAIARKQKILDKEEERQKKSQKTDLDIEDDMKRA